jgi:hypothetical protein
LPEMLCIANQTPRYSLFQRIGQRVLLWFALDGLSVRAERPSHFLFVRRRGGRWFWKCLGWLVALTEDKGSFDFANRFEGRIGLLRSG